MVIRKIHSWTLGGLIGAFLDLSLAYFLLCGSAFAFFASKFMNCFGLCVPCPCKGLLGYQNSNLCLHKFLIDWPMRKIYSVQIVAMERFPFDLIWFKDQACNLIVNLVRNRKCENGFLELDGEASCSSFSGPRLQNLADRESGYDAKGKGIMNQKQRLGIRRRMRATREYGKFSSVLLSDNSQSGVASVSRSPHDCSRRRSQISESLGPGSGREDGSQDDLYDGNATAGIDLSERTWDSIELNGPFDESRDMDKDSSSIEKFVSNSQIKLGIVGNEADVIRMLKRALEEEKAACAALYQDLEKERAAAATAADEAMAMISRLQKDKASMEMEARQYQMMTEENFAYVEEEMNILIEVLLRRERENHFLEKEVDAYREMSLLGNEQSEGDLSNMMDKLGQMPSSLPDSNEDPQLMLQQIENSKSTCMKEVGKTANWSFEAPEQSHTLASGKELTSQSKYLDSDLYTLQGLVQMSEMNYGPHGHRFNKKSTIIAEKQKEQKDNGIGSQGMTNKTGQTCTVIEKKISGDEDDLEKQGEHGNQVGSNLLDTELTVHDVHVIDDKTEVWKEESRKESGPSLCAASDKPRDCVLTYGASRVGDCEILNDSPSTSTTEIECDSHRSNINMSGLPMLGNSQCRTLLLDSERNPLSAVKSEILKIDNEVDWLRERLWRVQEGKEKLIYSAEHNERENAQLKLLEEIANRLRQIQQLREPVQQASLPPSSSKVRLKKRQC